MTSKIREAYFRLAVDGQGGRAGDYVKVSDLITSLSGEMSPDEVIASLNSMCETGLARVEVIYCFERADQNGQQWFILSDLP